jgi:glycosyltransferase involved in cell wall biosynthesis
MSRSSTPTIRDDAPRDSRPLLAMITGHLTPYRVHLNTRLASELTEMRLATLVTKSRSTMWSASPIPAIGTVLLDDSDRDWWEAPWGAFFRHEWKVARATVAWLNANKPSAIITAGHDEIPVNAAVWWARRRRVPVFLTADSNIRSDTSRGLKRLLKRIVLGVQMRRYTGMLPCGSLGRAFFEYYGADPKSIFPAPLEPDYAQIESVSAQEVAAARSKHALAENRRRIICVNRLVGLKRVDQVIAAFAAIAAERRAWDLVIVGDGPLRADLEGRVPAEHKERVKFLGHVADMREIGALYKASDVLVLASMHEAWALVVNEAMAAGCAIVVSDVVGAAPELVREGENGFTFPPGDLDALTDRLRKASAATAIDGLKAGSSRVLAAWRKTADPVGGVRSALRWCGVLK